MIQMILAIYTIMKTGRLLCHYTMYYGLVYYLIKKMFEAIGFV